MQHSDVYENPHEPFITALIKQNEKRIDYSRVLDMCCGSGEVTRALQNLDFKNQLGCDPFTSKLYREKTGCACLEYTFSDFLLPQTLTDSHFENRFSAIICSFALHLAPEKILYSFVQAMWQLSNTLVIITPHKRPALENLSNTKLVFEDNTLTQREKKIFLKVYTSK